MIRRAKKTASDTGGEVRVLSSLDRGKLVVEFTGAICRGDPNAPLPKAPAGGSGMWRPASTNGSEKK